MLRKANEKGVSRLDITKIQKLVRKAIKDYSIKATIDEETLVSFLSVDIVREVIADKKV